MSSRRALELTLDDLAGFEEPRVGLEQYATPPDVAAHLVHLADLRGDLGGTVVDLGAGTGVLALGAALRNPERVIGLERDIGALSIARENERRLDPPAPVAWVAGDAARPPLRLAGATVLMNPPFGAQRAGADRPFLEAASEVAAVSYSIHNAESEGFVEAFAGERGGVVTDAFEARLDLPRQFEFHDEAVREVVAEAFRIEWDQSAPR